MRKLVLVLLFSLLSTAFFGQAAFDKFDGQDDVTSVIVNKKMFEMMGSVKKDNKDKDSQQYLNLIKKLDNLKVFMSSSAKVSAEMKSTVTSYLKTNPLEELMRVNGDGKNVKIYVKSGANEKKCLYILAEINPLFAYQTGKNLSPNFLFVHLSGNISG